MKEKRENNDWSFQERPDDTPPRGGHPMVIILATVALLTVLSLLPWAKLTNNKFKDFNLLEDLFPGTASVVTEEIIDPELEAAMAEHIGDGNPETGKSRQAEASESEDPTMQSFDEPASLPSRINGQMVIEDYTPEGKVGGMEKLRRVFARASSQPIRIAVIGDSYIEGDIFTQDIRSKLQDIYGGNGVGYMAMHSNFPGFRRSVHQTSSGWTDIDIRKFKNDSIKPLAGEYYEAGENAQTIFEGTRSVAHADQWDRAVFAYISHVAGKLTMKVNDGVEQNFDVYPSEEVQFVTLEGPMRKVSLKCEAPGLKALGMWLLPRVGITLDCMSLRGNSGLSHRQLSRVTARELSARLPYDLIIMEYGINALSSQQEDYTPYSNLMCKVISELRRTHPEAEILMLGIGDRGQKSGTEIKSLPTAKAMVDAQRRAARKSGIMFWDTREAMGGENAIVTWREKGLVNADYIHLNHKGGRELADIFVDSFRRAIEQ